jgi:hypothetical protein
LATLQRLIEASDEGSPDPDRLQDGLDDFLAHWGPRLEAHLEAESRLVAPAQGSVADETGVLDTFRREGEHFSALLQLLNDGRGWLAAREPGAEAGIAAVVRDLSSLWGQHLRRVDVIAPLLSRFEDHRRA